MDATTTRASTVIRSIPTKEIRTQASITMPLSNTRSNTSIRLEPPDTRSTAIEGLLHQSQNSISRVCYARLACFGFLPGPGAEQAVAPAVRKNQATKQLSWDHTSTSSAQSVQLYPPSRPANGCEWST